MSMNLMKRTAISAALLAAAMTAGTAQAAGVVMLNVAGIQSLDAFGSPLNATRFIDILPNVRIVGVSWVVDLSTIGASWLSEISVDLNDGALAGASLSPGFGDNRSGNGAYSGSADLVALNADFYLGASGRLNFEFFETFVDNGGAGDGRWNSGTLSVSFVPEPASFGLAALALLGLGVTSTRRRQIQA